MPGEITERDIALADRVASMVVCERSVMDIAKIISEYRRTPESQKIRSALDDDMPGFSPKLQEALDAWYRRKTPEPGTSVVRWVRYDGTEGTLPNKSALVVRIDPGFSNKPMEMEVYFDDGVPAWKKGMTFWHMETGDFWANLPEPPEGVE